MNNLQKAFSAAAPSIIAGLEKRNMEGYYFESCEEMVQKILSMLPENSSVAWGGSESFTESGMLAALQNGNYQLIDRDAAVTAEEKRKLYSRTVMADAYFMSSNAITYDGILLNIDGSGNRLACLMHGPKEVFVIVGMNKFTKTVEAGIERIRNLASPANVQRLNRKTPCHETGLCADCFSPDCICSHLVVTRRSLLPGRIKVFMVAENLEY
jgi:Uncharacterised ACR, YkgG family COG1556.